MEETRARNDQRSRPSAPTELLRCLALAPAWYDTTMPPTTDPVSAGSAKLDRAVERLARTRVVLWVLMGLMTLSALRSIFSSHMRWTDWISLAGLVVGLILLLGYGDALAKFRALRNQHNLERVTMTHALVWVAVAISSVWQLL